MSLNTDLVFFAGCLTFLLAIVLVRKRSYFELKMGFVRIVVRDSSPESEPGISGLPQTTPDVSAVPVEPNDPPRTKTKKPR